MIIDFTEIESEAFELYARSFFEALGYMIIEHPDRGPDGGRDKVESSSCPVDNSTNP